MADVPHLALPFRFAAGVGRPAVTNEQDSLDDVAVCCFTACTFHLGQRVERPEWGLLDPVLAEPIAADALVTAVSEMEPRAEVYAEVDVDGEALIERVRLLIGRQEVTT